MNLSLNIAASPYDIIGLVETNISAELSDNELGLSGYNIYRCDRSPLTSTKSGGG